MKHLRTAHRKFKALVAVVIVATAVVVIASSTPLRAQMAPAGQGEEEASEQEQEGDPIVGTYNPQKVFQQYPGREKLMKLHQEAQSEMQGEQDQEKAQKLQQELQQEQQKIIGEFQDEVKDKLPGVADEAGVKVIAMEVQYTDDDIASQDLTDAVIEAIGGDPDAAQEPAGQPAKPAK